jgi:type 1 glutamine amidotransferase
MSGNLKIRVFITVVIMIFILNSVSGSVRILVITGGHGYNNEEFEGMLKSMYPEITYKIAELPAAFEMFKEENRSEYDVLVFYHMWQTITEDQENDLIDCIKEGKPLVVLHHSICAFDDWPEYWNIVGGKYFHKTTVYRGREFQPCSYIHDIRFMVNIVDGEHPVTRGVEDFEIFDETYKGYFVDDNVTPLLTATEQSSNPVIGWAKVYGKSRIVVLQSGHDVPTFKNQNFRKLLQQSIEWVIEK